jgi:hypothetical protein
MIHIKGLLLFVAGRERIEWKKKMVRGRYKNACSKETMLSDVEIKREREKSEERERESDPGFMDETVFMTSPAPLANWNLRWIDKKREIYLLNVKGLLLVAAGKKRERLERELNSIESKRSR